MRLLITGGSGFVGWNAVRYFADRGHRVLATYCTFSHYLHRVAGLEPVQLDLMDGSAIDRVVARFQPHLILHAAALARPQDGHGAERFIAVNVDGTDRLARAAAECGAYVVYLSTDLVYDADAGRCDERTPVNPSGAGEYSRSKLLGEKAVAASGAPWAVLRCSLMFGDGTPHSNSFSQFLDCAWAERMPAPVFSDQYRSMLYVDDLLRAVEAVAMGTAPRDQVYVCGGPERLSRAEFALRYADAVGASRALCRVMHAAELEGYVGGASDITLDTAKLRGAGWRPTPLADAFARMLRGRNPELA